MVGQQIKNTFPATIISDSWVHNNIAILVFVKLFICLCPPPPTPPLTGCPKSLLNKHQRHQNSASLRILRARKWDSATLLLKIALAGCASACWA